MPADTVEMEELRAKVPVDLVRHFEELAEKHDRTLSAEVRRAMREHLAAEDRRRDRRAE